ncbi:MAG: spore germination protein GerW family protein [Symbiobacterium sp.]|uniref:GerW family sporulation protein n=1 Tax=Symbiobacterium sp. TaxID=1971213 RepID=UPI0034649444
MPLEFLSVVTETLEKHLSTKTVVGEPVTVGAVTLIPVIDITFGFGAGSGEGHDERQGGSGGGGGGGARLSARAVIVIRDGDVSVLPLHKGGAIDKIVESIPGLLEQVQARKQGEKAQNEAAQA